MLLWAIGAEFYYEARIGESTPAAICPQPSSQSVHAHLPCYCWASLGPIEAGWTNWLRFARIARFTKGQGPPIGPSGIGIGTARTLCGGQGRPGARESAPLECPLRSSPGNTRASNGCSGRPTMHCPCRTAKSLSRLNLISTGGSSAHSCCHGCCWPAAALSMNHAHNRILL